MKQSYKIFFILILLFILITPSAVFGNIQITASLNGSRFKVGENITVSVFIVGDTQSIDSVSFYLLTDWVDMPQLLGSKSVVGNKVEFTFQAPEPIEDSNSAKVKVEYKRKTQTLATAETNWFTIYIDTTEPLPTRNDYEKLIAKLISEYTRQYKLNYNTTKQVVFKLEGKKPVVLIDGVKYNIIGYNNSNYVEYILWNALKIAKNDIKVLKEFVADILSNIESEKEEEPPDDYIDVIVDVDPVFNQIRPSFVHSVPEVKVTNLPIPTPVLGVEYGRLDPKLWGLFSLAGTEIPLFYIYGSKVYINPLAYFAAKIGETFWNDYTEYYQKLSENEKEKYIKTLETLFIKLGLSNEDVKKIINTIKNDNNNNYKDNIVVKLDIKIVNGKLTIEVNITGKTSSGEKIKIPVPPDKVEFPKGRDAMTIIASELGRYAAGSFAYLQASFNGSNFEWDVNGFYELAISILKGEITDLKQTFGLEILDTNYITSQNWIIEENYDTYKVGNAPPSNVWWLGDLTIGSFVLKDPATGLTADFYIKAIESTSGDKKTAVIADFAARFYDSEGNVVGVICTFETTNSDGTKEKVVGFFDNVRLPPKEVLDYYKNKINELKEKLKDPNLTEEEKKALEIELAENEKTYEALRSLGGGGIVAQVAPPPKEFHPSDINFKVSSKLIINYNLNSENINRILKELENTQSASSQNVVYGDTPTVQVVYPNGGEEFNEMQTISVQFTASNLPSNCYFNVYLINNNSVVYSKSVTASPVNINLSTISYLPASNNYKVKVELYQRVWDSTYEEYRQMVVASDTSDAPFRIYYTNPFKITKPQAGSTINLSSTNGTLPITYILYIDPSEFKSLKFYLVYNGENELYINTITQTTTNITVNANLNLGLPLNYSNVKIKGILEDINGKTYIAYSPTFNLVSIDNNYTFVKLISPIGGEIINPNTNYEIKYFLVANYDNIESTILLFKYDNQEIILDYKTTGFKLENTFNWLVPDIASSNCYIYILVKEKDNPNYIYSMNLEPFTIKGVPIINVLNDLSQVYINGDIVRLEVELGGDLTQFQYLIAVVKYPNQIYPNRSISFIKDNNDGKYYGVWVVDGFVEGEYELSFRAVGPNNTILSNKDYKINVKNACKVVSPNSDFQATSGKEINFDYSIVRLPRYIEAPYKFGSSIYISYIRLSTTDGSAALYASKYFSTSDLELKSFTIKSNIPSNFKNGTYQITERCDYVLPNSVKTPSGQTITISYRSNTYSYSKYTNTTTLPFNMIIPELSLNVLAPQDNQEINIINNNVSLEYNIDWSGGPKENLYLLLTKNKQPSFTVALFRPSTKTYYVCNYTTNSFYSVSSYGSGNLPAYGLFKGLLTSNYDAYGTFNTSNNTFFIGGKSFVIGNSGDLPIVGDWDGDGVWDYGVFRPSENKFYFRNILTGETTSTALGNSGDLPVVGDWDGDGKFDVGVYRPSTGQIFYRVNNTTNTINTGITNAKVIAGDWDGDGKFEFAIYYSKKFRLINQDGSLIKEIVPSGITVADEDIPTIAGTFTGYSIGTNYSGSRNFSVSNPETGLYTFYVIRYLSINNYWIYKVHKSIPLRVPDTLTINILEPKDGDKLRVGLGVYTYIKWEVKGFVPNNSIFKLDLLDANNNIIQTLQNNIQITSNSIYNYPWKPTTTLNIGEYYIKIYLINNNQILTEKKIKLVLPETEVTTYCPKNDLLIRSSSIYYLFDFYGKINNIKIYINNNLIKQFTTTITTYYLDLENEKVSSIAGSPNTIKVFGDLIYIGIYIKPGNNELKVMIDDTKTYTFNLIHNPNLTATSFVVYNPYSPLIQPISYTINPINQNIILRFNMNTDNSNILIYEYELKEADLSKKDYIIFYKFNNKNYYAILNPTTINSYYNLDLVRYNLEKPNSNPTKPFYVMCSSLTIGPTAIKFYEYNNNKKQFVVTETINNPNFPIKNIPKRLPYPSSIGYYEIIFNNGYVWRSYEYTIFDSNLIKAPAYLHITLKDSVSDILIVSYFIPLFTDSIKKGKIEINLLNLISSDVISSNTPVIFIEDYPIPKLNNRFVDNEGQNILNLLLTILENRDKTDYTLQINLVRKSDLKILSKSVIEKFEEKLFEDKTSDLKPIIFITHGMLTPSTEGGSGLSRSYWWGFYSHLNEEEHFYYSKQTGLITLKSAIKSAINSYLNTNPTLPSDNPYEPPLQFDPSRPDVVSTFVYHYLKDLYYIYIYPSRTPCWIKIVTPNGTTTSFVSGSHYTTKILAIKPEDFNQNKSNYTPLVIDNNTIILNDDIMIYFIEYNGSNNNYNLYTYLDIPPNITLYQRNNVNIPELIYGYLTGTVNVSVKSADNNKFEAIFEIFYRGSPYNNASDDFDFKYYIKFVKNDNSKTFIFDEYSHRVTESFLANHIVKYTFDIYLYNKYFRILNTDLFKAYLIIGIRYRTSYTYYEFPIDITTYIKSREVRWASVRDAYYYYSGCLDKLYTIQGVNIYWNGIQVKSNNNGLLDITIPNDYSSVRLELLYSVGGVTYYNVYDYVRSSITNYDLFAEILDSDYIWDDSYNPFEGYLYSGDFLFRITLSTRSTRGLDWETIKYSYDYRVIEKIKYIEYNSSFPSSVENYNIKSKYKTQKNKAKMLLVTKIRFMSPPSPLNQKYTIYVNSAVEYPDIPIIVKISGAYGILEYKTLYVISKNTKYLEPYYSTFGYSYTSMSIENIYPTYYEKDYYVYYNVSDLNNVLSIPNNCKASFVPKFDINTEYSHGAINGSFVYYLNDYVYKYIIYNPWLPGTPVGYIINGRQVLNYNITFGQLLSQIGVTQYPFEIKNMKIVFQNYGNYYSYDIYPRNGIYVVSPIVPFIPLNLGHEKYEPEKDIYSYKQVYNAGLNTFNIDDTPLTDIPLEKFEIIRGKPIFINEEDIRLPNE